MYKSHKVNKMLNKTTSSTFCFQTKTYYKTTVIKHKLHVSESNNQQNLKIGKKLVSMLTQRWYKVN